MNYISPRADAQRHIPFDEINAAALAAYPGLLHGWFPAGRVAGHEFLVGDLRGSPGKSLSINVDTGRWADFAGDAKGGDPISLAAAAFHNGDQGAAARDLGSRLGFEMNGKAGTSNPVPRPSSRPNSTWIPMVPPPTDAPEPAKRELGQYDTLHTYRDAAGRPLFYVRRHDARGTKKKFFTPLTYGALNGVTGWHAKHPAAPRPLYGLEELAQHPNAPPILCEGEKAADAARFMFPGHACMTWPGGSGAVAQADFGPLKKLEAVIVWPDNDAPGRKAAAEIVARLPHARVLDVSDLPEGHDAADILPDDPQAWLSGHLPTPTSKQDEPPLRRNSVTAAHSFVTEDSVALAFTRAHRDDLRFCHTAGAWFRWTGAIWRKEVTRLAFDWAREIGRDLSEGNGNDKVRAIAGKSAFAIGVERFAQADRAFAVTGEMWDADPWLLGTPGGTVDLRTGLLRPARQADHITKSAAVTPADRADCPQWLEFLDQATAGDRALVGFLRRWFGYTLTGITREHALLFVFGDGGNGKGVAMNTVAGIMGDYAVNAAMDSFTASKGDKHPTDMAMLAGARMVMTTEVDEGQVWAEARLKALTGGDPITARFMRRDFFTFTPAFKLTISGNHKPQLRNVDAAARRRFNLAPFIHKPATPDKGLPEKLKAAWPSILRWMIDGCMEWQHDGLQQPDVVKLATEEYFAEQNVMAQWIEECCEVGKNLADTNASLFGSWRNYAQAQSEEPRTGKWFNKALVAQSGEFESIKDKHGIRGRGFRGIRVRFDAPQGDDR